MSRVSAIFLLLFSIATHSLFLFLPLALPIHMCVYAFCITQKKTNREPEQEKKDCEQEKVEAKKGQHI